MPMEYLRLILIALVVVGIGGFINSWVHAYQKVENIVKWKDQLIVLQPWWILDSKLLPKEHDYIRNKSNQIICVVFGAAGYLMVDI